MLKRSVTRLPYDQYQSGDYFKNNPDWDQDDSSWKAERILELIKDHDIQPRDAVEVGCGAGRVLAELSRALPATQFAGYDIAPDAARFWDRYRSPRLTFANGDFLALNHKRYDLLFMLDVVEHVPDPLAFMAALKDHAELFMFHIPLDLSASSVLRSDPLLHVRDKVGHIHYFNKALALQMLKDCGYHVVEWRYTGAAFNAPGRRLKTWLASLPRYALGLFNKDFAVRLFGGETLLVLASAS